MAEQITNNIEVTEEHLTYLDNLRESGIVNMFGAVGYIRSEFDLSKTDATDVLTHWMKTFVERREG